MDRAAASLPPTFSHRVPPSSVRWGGRSSCPTATQSSLWAPWERPHRMATSRVAATAGPGVAAMPLLTCPSRILSKRCRTLPSAERALSWARASCGLWGPARGTQGHRMTQTVDESQAPVQTWPSPSPQATLPTWPRPASPPVGLTPPDRGRHGAGPGHRPVAQARQEQCGQGVWDGGVAGPGGS